MRLEGTYMGWLFQFLFKYPRVVFEQGDLGFAISRSTTLWIAALAAVGAAALITYRGITSEGPTRERIVLVVLRLAALGVLILCLFRPTLILKAAVPQQNFLGVILDDSRSMTIADRDGQPRHEFIQKQFAADGALQKALADRFVLRFFRFSTTADRLSNVADLKYAGTASRIGTALDRARDELAGLPLAGIVMVTDGADTSDASLDESIASLKARSIPVFTVGLGQEKFARDVQITRVETPRSTLKGTSLAVDVVLTQTGYSGQTVPLQVEDNGRIVSSQEVKLPDDGQSATVRVNFTAADAGARVFRFKLPPQNDEQVTQNNTRDALVEVNDRREKVLYMEGEPRFEPKFIRRAVEDDKNLNVVLLQRTAEDKYYRMDVESPEELVGGFPKTREELFAYRGIILGSVEAASFTPEQLRMLADFVSKRGGGLLMLGGRRSFAEGGWAGTPVAEVLPIEFDANAARGNAPEFLLRDMAVRPTRAGSTYPVTQLDATEQASNARWGEMPPVSAVNLIRGAKPGATVLLTGSGDGRREQIVLAYQRYGRGKSMAFPVQDSWLWQMDAPVAVDDMTHEMFWRRMVRWLVDGVPDPVAISTAVDRVEPGEPIKLSAEVVDPAFVEVNDAQVVAEVRTPSGKSTEVKLEWTVSRAGEYRGTFVPEEPGTYEIRGTAVRSKDGVPQDLGTSVIHARASAGDSEYFDAAMRSSLLTRISDDTGGRFFTSSATSSLAEAISYSGRGVTVVEERDLWDMPALLILLLGIIGAEWGYRRVRGLA
jgi:uncharacterized membrane protein